MGTPGDKSTYGKVASSNNESDPASEKESLLSSSLVDQSSSSSFQLLQSTDMGVLTQIPALHFLTSTESVSHAVSKPEVFQQTLEQASIEDYFSQTKFYPSISENVPSLYSVSPPSTFQSIDQPGPSGLQFSKNQTAIPAKLKKKKQERLTPKKSHTCPICHKSYSTGAKFNKHYQSHSGSTPFKCELCKKSFSSRFKLVRHALIHSDKKPFSCTVCERTFHRKDHLKNHIKVHSPTKKIYECEKNDCNKQYTSLFSYRKHLAVHAVDEGNLTCQICFESFETKDEILYHLKIHAGSRTVKHPNEKKYLCDYCDRRFFTKKDVRRHLVVHTGMRDFLCQFCPQRFGRKDHLVRHIKKSHKKQYSEESSGVNIKSEIPRPETITSDVNLDVSLDTSDFVDSPYIAEKSLTPFKLTDPKPQVDESTYKSVPYVGLEPDSMRSGIMDVKAEQIEHGDLGLEGVKTIFEEESLTPLNEDELYLSTHSTQSELKEFCSEIFKHISETTVTSSDLLDTQTQSAQGPAITEEEILGSQMFDILEDSENDNNTLPLPGFSQTFQPPPPP